MTAASAPDFTTSRYRELLASASRRFRFIRFGGDDGRDGVALWRHDVDFSPHRALAMAGVERDLALSSTYFFQVSSRFYNVLEPDIAPMLRAVVALGHGIGLHFDPSVIAGGSEADYERRLRMEADVLSEVVGATVTAFTLHNPTTFTASVFERTTLGGMLNGSHASLRAQFSYCSDSNGVWRHRPLEAVLGDPAVRRVYALTHPEWWQDSAMPPRARVQRCIDGRAEGGGRYYDALLERHGRPNVGGRRDS